MKLANIRYQNRDLVVISLPGGRLVNVNELPPLVSRPIPKMLDLIRGGRELMDALRASLTEQAVQSTTPIPPADVTWYPPVRRPGKIYAVAMNNAASHDRSVGSEEHPAFSLKPPSCLIGHRESIRLRRYYGSVHPEPELAAVVWGTMRDVPARNALESVFGYTIFNDVTSSGMRAEDQVRHAANGAKKNGAGVNGASHAASYAGRYKGADTFGVMGPWLVTADEVPDPDALGVSCTVGGEKVAEDSTRFYNYKVAEVLSYISHFHTLDAGDVVAFGRAYDPARANGKLPADLQTARGPVHVSIDCLGAQENPVVIENEPLGEWRLA